MKGSADAADRAGLVCVSVPGRRVPLPVLEALSFGRDELSDALPDLQRRAGASQLCVVSTCERVEVYATGTPGPASLVRALAGSRGVPVPAVGEAADVLTGGDAARHLLRVTAGLESFVLGESDIVGQVRAAAAAACSAGVGGLELERLAATAVNTSRRVHRTTSFGEAGRSVAAAAVEVAAAEDGGDLTGRRVVVVGAGEVAAQVVDSAVRLGAAVTVCSRNRRRAGRLAEAGATVVDLGQLLAVLATADVAIFGTAAPEPLVGAAQLAGVRSARGPGLLVIDLCVPRNVDPAVRELGCVRLLDLADLRSTGAVADEAVTRDVALAEQVVEDELGRYLRWLARRSAAASVQRLRTDVEACVRSHVEQATRGVPDDLRPLVEDRVRRAVLQLAHEPTRRLLEAAEAGDEELVEVLAGVFAPTAAGQAPPDAP